MSDVTAVTRSHTWRENGEINVVAAKRVELLLVLCSLQHILLQRVGSMCANACNVTLGDKAVTKSNNFYLFIFFFGDSIRMTRILLFPIDFNLFLKQVELSHRTHED